MNLNHERQFWIETLTKIVQPVLTAGAEGKLPAVMPIEVAPQGSNPADRRLFTHLEAVGRSLAGLAPWLELAEPASAALAGLARQTIAASCDPQSPGRVNFTTMGQPVVDAAFLAHALLRAPTELWSKLDARAQTNVIDCLRATRQTKPAFCNWLLFSAIIEAFLQRATGQCDQMRVDYAVRQHEQWYKGDGVYGDGPDFHWDYYNSFVIQPMLLDTVAAVPIYDEAWQTRLLRRAQRYAVVQERLIAPDGSFPPLGRSLAYRTGAFQLLAQLALQQHLPAELPPAQVRTALTAVMERVFRAAGTFDAAGWLTIGLCGHQPSLAEAYISTGSLYLCTTGFLPLGLPATDAFWSQPPRPWTSHRAWRGEDLPADHALY